MTRRWMLRVVGTMLSAFMLAAFFAIARTAQVPPSPSDREARLMAALHKYAHANPSVTAVLRGVTMLGSVWVLGGLTAGVTAALVWRRKYRLGFAWASVLLGGGVLNILLKAAFQRARPHFSDPVAWETNTGFPSGHMMGAVICYGMLGYLLSLMPPGGVPRALGCAGLLSLVLAIGFSRVYLGVHYPSDVLAASAAGSAWLAAAITTTECSRGSTRHYENDL